MLQTAVLRMISSEEQTASGIHRLRTRLRRAAIDRARSRTTRCVRLTTEARAGAFKPSIAIRTTAGDSSPENSFSLASFIYPPPQTDERHEAAPSLASTQPGHDIAGILRSITELGSRWRSRPKKVLRKNEGPEPPCRLNRASGEPHLPRRSSRATDTGPVEKVQASRSQRDYHPLPLRSSHPGWPLCACGKDRSPGCGQW